ncbi:MAG: ABC-2 transporter permease [Clostridia bacterium]
MKGLLIKDILTLKSQMKIYLLLILLFSIMPNFTFSGFAIMLGAMLPITVLSYDERSKWDILASTMPYSAKELVISKFLLGYFLILSTTVLSCIATFVMSLFTTKEALANDFLAILITALLGATVLSISLAVMFKFGVEKGRYFFIATVLVTTILITTIARLSVDLSKFDFLLNQLNLVLIAIFIACILINALSILISIKIYTPCKN